MRISNPRLERREVTWFLVLLAVAFGVAAGVRQHLRSRVPVVWSRRDVNMRSYEPRFGASTGREITLFYVGKRNCAQSRSSQVVADVKAILLELDRDTRGRGMGLGAIGVALDWSTAEGIEHLKSVADFDEVHAGRNWVNSYFLNDLVTAYGVAAATPTLVLVERSLIVPDKLHPSRQARLSPGRVVAIAKGVSEIHLWRSSRPWRAAVEETGAQ